MTIQQVECFENGGPPDSIYELNWAVCRCHWTFASPQSCCADLTPNYVVEITNLMWAMSSPLVNKWTPPGILASRLANVWGRKRSKCRESGMPLSVPRKPYEKKVTSLVNKWTPSGTPKFSLVDTRLRTASTTDLQELRSACLSIPSVVSGAHFPLVSKWTPSRVLTLLLVSQRAWESQTADFLELAQPLTQDKLKCIRLF